MDEQMTIGACVPLSHKLTSEDRDVNILNNILILQTRIKELESAILEHHDTFPDEALEGEFKLWRVIGIEME